MCESRDGPIIADFTDDARDAIISSSDHGFHTLSFFVPMGTRQSFDFYNLAGVPFIGVFYGGDPVWEGRVEDIALVDGGISIHAFGFWSALSDAPYTALWSYSSVANWEVLTDDDISYFLPDRWTLDNNNRLYMAPNKDENFGSTSAWGGWGFKRPDGSENYLLEIDYDYAFLAPANWRFRLRSYTGDAWTSFTNEYTLTGTGSLQSGSRSDTLAANATSLMFALYYDTTAADYTGETGDVYLKITNLRVKAVTTATLTAKVIVEDLVSYIADLNGDITDNGTAIFDPGVDLKDAVFEDEYPADIITALALLGDDSTPPQLFDASIWESGYLHFHSYGGFDHLEWYTDVINIELERSLESLKNSWYAVYEGNQRTAVAKDNDSIAIHGIERRGSLSVNTSSQTQAEAARDAQLECTCGQPRAQISIDGLFDIRGGEYPYWMMRAGDLVTLRNLEPDINELDKLRTFRVNTTELHLNTNILYITPEELPDVDILVAKGNL